MIKIDSSKSYEVYYNLSEWTDTTMKNNLQQANASIPLMAARLIASAIIVLATVISEIFYLLKEQKDK